MNMPYRCLWQFVFPFILLSFGVAAKTNAQSSVELVGNYSYSANLAADTVLLNVTEILNNSTAYTTGTLRLELWLTTTPYTGGPISGFRIAIYQLTGPSNGQLGPGQYFSNITQTLPLTGIPAAGSYYVTLLVSEYTQNCGTTDGYCIDTYGPFPNQFNVTGGGNGSDSGSYVQLVGSYSYSASLSGGTVQLAVAEIINTSSTYTTGSLRLELWLTTNPYAGGNISGNRVAIYRITGSSNGQLAPNEEFTNVSATVPLSNLPGPGSYYVTLIVSEYTQACGTSDGYCIDTYGSFSDPLVIPTSNSTDNGGTSGSGGGGGALGPWELAFLCMALLSRLGKAAFGRFRVGPARAFFLSVCLVPALVIAYCPTSGRPDNCSEQKPTQQFRPNVPQPSARQAPAQVGASASIPKTAQAQASQNPLAGVQPQPPTSERAVSIPSARAHSESSTQNANSKNQPARQADADVRTTSHFHTELTSSSQHEGARGATLNRGRLPLSERGRAADFFPNGQVRATHSRTVDMVRAMNGERITTVHRPNNVLLVSYGPRAGYLQRPLTYHGHKYLQRTYVFGGAVFHRNYVAYSYGGFVYYSLVPPFYYAPTYYSWLINPWGAPVVYSWDWQASSWYSYEHGYFPLYPVYASPAAWLTDYYLGTLIETSYLAQATANTAVAAVAQQQRAATATGNTDSDSALPAGSTITPALKQQLTEEVEQQLPREEAAAATSRDPGILVGLLTVLQPGHLFVVDHPMNVITEEGSSCSLSIGDVLRLAIAPRQDIPLAQLQIAASHQGDCPETSGVTVGFDDLQEMYNSFRTQIAAGSEALRRRADGSGLPAAPPSSARVVEGPPAPSTDVSGLVAEANAQGTQMEQAIEADAGGNK